MSFGDNSSPITNFVTGFTRQFDQVLGPAFNADRTGPSAPTPPPSLVNQKPQSVSVDTPGRHKTLLGQ